MKKVIVACDSFKGTMSSVRVYEIIKEVLTSKHGAEVMDLLKQLHAEGTTIVMVTHSQHDANYADRIVRLFDGEVVAEVEM